MIDYAVLCAFTPFAAIMQLHPGWVGMMQKRYLSALGCLWFNRTQSKDRALVTQRMKDHVWSVDATPLLIFPEGTCVNNEHCVMFKRGAFDLGATVCPIAIKYNKIFVDAFWNSKRQSFTQHLSKIMRSWALVADVWFLEPQTRREGETATEFAERVQKMISVRARLKIAPWDGYLKYYNLGEKHPDLVERQRTVYAERVKKWLWNTTVKMLCLNKWFKYYNNRMNIFLTVHAVFPISFQSTVFETHLNMLTNGFVVVFIMLFWFFHLTRFLNTCNQ